MQEIINVRKVCKVGVRRDLVDDGRTTDGI